MNNEQRQSKWDQCKSDKQKEKVAKTFKIKIFSTKNFFN